MGPASPRRVGFEQLEERRSSEARSAGGSETRAANPPLREVLERRPRIVQRHRVAFGKPRHQKPRRGFPLVAFDERFDHLRECGGAGEAFPVLPPERDIVRVRFANRPRGERVGGELGRFRSFVADDARQVGDSGSRELIPPLGETSHVRRSRAAWRSHRPRLPRRWAGVEVELPPGDVDEFFRCTGRPGRWGTTLIAENVPRSMSALQPIPRRQALNFREKGFRSRAFQVGGERIWLRISVPNRTARLSSTSRGRGRVAHRGMEPERRFVVRRTPGDGLIRKLPHARERLLAASIWHAAVHRARACASAMASKLVAVARDSGRV